MFLAFSMQMKISAVVAILCINAGHCFSYWEISITNFYNNSFSHDNAWFLFLVYLKD